MPGPTASASARATSQLPWGRIWHKAQSARASCTGRCQRLGASAVQQARKSMHPRHLLAALVVALPAAASAQETTPPAQAAPAEIVVTGTGLARPPAAQAYDTTVIDADRLAASASGRIEDALGAVAGFQQFRRSDSRSANPSAQGVTLRALGGNATSRSLVLLDGVPLASVLRLYPAVGARARTAGARPGDARRRGGGIWRGCGRRDNRAGECRAKRARVAQRASAGQ